MLCERFLPASFRPKEIMGQRFRISLLTKMLCEFYCSLKVKMQNYILTKLLSCNILIFEILCRLFFFFGATSERDATVLCRL